MPHFVPRQRKHKVRQRDAAQNGNPSTNEPQLLPQSKSEKEEKRRNLESKLRAGQPSISSQKKKRLLKYIDNKLRKDENLQLLKNLSQGPALFDTSSLQSSKHLGKRNHAQFTADAPARPRAAEQSMGSSDVDSESEESLGENHADSLNGANDDPKPLSKEGALSAERGGGLKNPLALGEDGLPIIQMRWGAKIKQKPLEELPWEGFDTESGSVQVDTADAALSARDSISSSNLDTSYEFDSQEELITDLADASTSKPTLRSSAFKAWATQQINESLGHEPFHTPAGVIRIQPAASLEHHVDKISYDKEVPQPATQINQEPNSERKTYNVHVTRSAAIEESRAKLPLVAEEQKIMEAIHDNPVVIIWGATGSGKTTQVPQFLFEAGYSSAGTPTPGMIGVTQPRRVAAVSMAKRVGDELGEHSGKVSYQIRFESTTSKQTAIKFMTDGILLREISQDFALSKYSIIIIDEAHERSVNTDILIGMVSRIVDLRARMRAEDSSIGPLKLVIMSATLRMSDFLQNANLFQSGPPPLIEAEGRQYPVTIHFARQTKRDYLEEAFRKVCRGHCKLPPGGILLFLTGQNEIRTLMKRLQNAFTSSARYTGTSAKVRLAASEAPLETEDLELGGFDDVEGGEDESDIDIITGEGQDNKDQEPDFDIGEEPSPDLSVHLLALYSQLPTKEQLHVFEPPPIGSRMIVLATNVAETSLTIPGIRYVFDCGRSKERLYRQSTGVQSFEVGWISQASAEQRAGRAGRTGPGHCYRLYSSAVYERDFVQHADPEILRTPIETVVLQMKTIGLDNILNFPFPTPPPSHNLVRAEKLLKHLGCLAQDGHITKLGKSISLYPLSPRFGKMLAIGSQHGCLPYVIALVAGLAVADIFIPENQIDLAPRGQQEGELYTNADRESDAIRERRRKDFNKARTLFSKYDQHSDALKVLTAVCAAAYANDGEVFCHEMFLRLKAVQEVAQLRRQLTDIVRANDAGLIGVFEARLPEASPKQLKALNQIVSAGFIDQVAIRADLAPTAPEVRRKARRAIDVPYLTLFPRSSKAATLEETAIYLHPSSILARLSANEMPPYLVYSHLQQSGSSLVAAEKISQIRFFPLTATSGAHLSTLAHGTPLVSYGKPIGHVVSLGGSPERRECWVVPSLTGEAGSTGWPLPAKKVLQRKDAKAAWHIEKFLS